MRYIQVYKGFLKYVTSLSRRSNNIFENLQSTEFKQLQYLTNFCFEKKIHHKQARVSKKVPILIIFSMIVYGIQESFRIWILLQNGPWDPHQST